MIYEFVEFMETNNLISFPVNKHLDLKYGTMSIQASEFHYCMPRVSDLHL